MALSIREKLTLQKIVNEKKTALMQGGMSIRQKLETQKAMLDALKKLNVAIDAGKTSPLLERLLAGEFDNEKPNKFLTILEDVVKELEGDVKPVIPPTAKYIERNRGSVLESALSGMIGRGA